MPSFEMTMTMFWLIAMVFFLVVEAVTVGLVCIWFAAGSLVALLCAMFDAPAACRDYIADNEHQHRNDINNECRSEYSGAKAFDHDLFARLCMN